MAFAVLSATLVLPNSNTFNSVIVRSESGIEREHLVPHGKRFLVHTGDVVRSGQALVDGPLVPHDPEQPGRALPMPGIAASQLPDPGVDFILQNFIVSFRSAEPLAAEEVIDFKKERSYHTGLEVTF